MTAPLIYVLILHWKGKKDTLSCLASLEKVDYSPFETVVIDNGSFDSLEEEIHKKFPSVFFLQNGKNLGYAEGNNRGILYALSQGAQAVLLLNNDTIVSPDFLTELVETKKAFPRGGIFGSKSLSLSLPDTIDHIGGFWKEEIAEFVCHDKGKPNYKSPPFLVDYVSGCALLIEKQVIEKIGLLDARFFLLWEEADFCTRAKKEGFEIVAAPSSLIWHKVSASFSGKPLLHYYWWRNRLLFLKKNFPFNKRKALYRACIFSEILREFRHFLLKGLEAVFLKILSPQKFSEEKQQKLKRYKAGCKGIWDYFLKKFHGPVFLP